MSRWPARVCKRSRKPLHEKIFFRFSSTGFLIVHTAIYYTLHHFTSGVDPGEERESGGRISDKWTAIAGRF